MKQMPAGKFKARCLAVVDDVCATGEVVVITKHGKPVAKLVPVERTADDFIGSLKGVLEIRGDLMAAGSVPPEAWEH